MLGGFFLDVTLYVPSVITPQVAGDFPVAWGMAESIWIP